MLGFLLKKKSESSNIAKIHNLLHNSFVNVKRDTFNIFHWIKYLHHKSVQQDHLIRNIHDHLSNQPDVGYHINIAIEDYHSKLSSHLHRQIQYHVLEALDSHYKLDAIDSKLSNLHDKINELSIHKENISPKIAELEAKVRVIEQRKQDIKANLREKLLKKITKNSKDYVKNMIISLIRKYGKVSGLQLKEMLVDEQGLCSKSTFYRILNELESSPEINMVWEGKEKVFFSKIAEFTEKR